MEEIKEIIDIILIGILGYSAGLFTAILIELKS
jgi:hypothetical protein